MLGYLEADLTKEKTSSKIILAIKERSYDLQSCGSLTDKFKPEENNEWY